MKNASVSKIILSIAFLTIFTLSTSCGGGSSDVTAASESVKYTVTYAGNGNTGGNVPVDEAGYEQGASVMVLGNTNNLVKTGYTFIGWCLQANGSGTSYTPGQIFIMGAANVTLYAKWTANPTYTVTYSGNGNTSGSVPVDTTGYESGANVTVPGNTGNLSRTGYTFTGWNTQANGAGTSYTQGQIFTMGTSNVTLYAKWTANPTFTVTYSGNGNTSGIVPVDTTGYESGANVTVPGNTGNLSRTGYTFTGWNTQANGAGTSYTQGQIFTMGTLNVTLYAKWTANPTYTVTYAGNGNTSGSVPVDTTGYEQGTSVTILGNTGNLARTGYAFTGWNTLANGGGTLYTAGQILTMGTSNVTLYAVWTANPTNSNFIIDHTCTKLSSIPQDWIRSAKSSLHIAYQHTSHGSQIVTGMYSLPGFKGSLYSFNEGGTGGALDLRDEVIASGYDLGNPDRTAWASKTRDYLRNNPGINVIMWAWCGQVSTATVADINTYLSLMSQLEADFPGVKFVYMTGHTDGTGPSGNLAARNKQIRDYCIANNKILYDFADIESYDPDGNYYGNRYVTGGCNYDYNNDGTTSQSSDDPPLPTGSDRNWALDWQKSHTEGIEWYYCGSAHSQPLNANQKAYAAWWMFARLAGWNGE
ncbi:MAG TPA: InlB B-repeat-containing protein [Desulfomonilia bacterium]